MRGSEQRLESGAALGLGATARGRAEVPLSPAMDAEAWRCRVGERGWMKQKIRGSSLSGGIENSLAYVTKVVEEGPRTGKEDADAAGGDFDPRADFDQSHAPCAGVTFAQLDALAYAISDNEAARHLNEARTTLFRSINQAQQPAA